MGIIGKSFNILPQSMLLLVHLILFVALSGCNEIKVTEYSPSNATIDDTDGPIDNGTNIQFTNATDSDGNNIAMSWIPFSDNAGVINHRIKLYTENTCWLGEIDLGLTGTGLPIDNGIVDGIPLGNYWAKVIAYDANGNSKASTCSTDFIRVLDSIAPVDQGANVQFTAATSSDGNNIAMTWTAFTDNVGIINHRIKLYTNNTCTTGLIDAGLTGSSLAVDNGVVDSIPVGTYYATVTAYDADGNSKTSSCSTDFITVLDSTPPVDQVANIQFTDATDNDGNDIAMTWTAFTDNVGVTNHRIKLYTNNACSAGEIDLGLTGTASAVDNGIVDAIPSGTYYATVTAYDAAGNSTTSICSSDSVIVPVLATPPVDNGANPQFTAATDSDGNDIAMTWTAFSDDVAVTNHRIKLYTDNACTLGEIDLGLTGSALASDNGIVDGIPTGTYYATITAYDGGGNSTTSSCSTDSIQRTTLSSEVRKITSDGEANDTLGVTIAQSGNRIIIGAPLRTSNTGVAYIYELNSATGVWDETKLTASDPASNAQFGYGVDIDGHRAVVGARGALSDRGAVYLYEYNPATQLWAEKKLLSSDGVASDYFGISVSISGNSIMAGAILDDDKGSASGSAYIYQFNPTTKNWDETKLVASDGIAAQYFGYHVQLFNNLALATAPGDATKGSNAGAAYLFQFNPVSKTWVQIQKFTASNGVASDTFGEFRPSMKGNTIVIGVPEKNSNSGAVFVYQLDPQTNSWNEIILTPAGPGTFFGYTVALEGNTLLVGAPGDNDRAVQAGAVYVYRYDGVSKTWVQVSKVAPTALTTGVLFGISVSLAGTRAAISVPYDQESGVNVGSFYVMNNFTGNISTRGETKLVASDASANSSFGQSVSIQGSNAVVGSPNTVSSYVYQYNVSTGVWDETKLVPTTGTGIVSYGQSVSISERNILIGASDSALKGSAYIYQFKPDTATWKETQLLASDGANGDDFGLSVDLTGNTAVVGAPGKGAVYIYQLNTVDGSWVEFQKLTSADAGYGYSVSISGQSIAVGADQTSTAYLYQYHPTSKTWAQVQQLTSGQPASEAFGSSISVFSNSVLVGAPHKNSDTGGAYLFEYNPTTQVWDLTKTFIASDAAIGDKFGTAVGLYGDSVVIGAPGDDDRGSNAGATYIFNHNKSGNTWDQKSKITVKEGAAGFAFGSSVDVWANGAIAGSPLSATGSAYLISVD